MWKMVLSCLIWRIWRERNDQNFEVRKKTVVELKAFFFNSLYHWMVAYAYIFLPFMIFLIFFLLLVKCFPCILHVYLGCALVLLMNSYYFLKKKMSTKEMIKENNLTCSIPASED
jgi:hypothetical protein